MRKRMLIGSIVAFFAGGFLAPPDAVSELAYGLLAALFCVTAWRIIARRDSVEARR